MAGAAEAFVAVAMGMAEAAIGVIPPEALSDLAAAAWVDVPPLAFPPSAPGAGLAEALPAGAVWGDEEGLLPPPDVVLRMGVPPLPTDATTAVAAANAEARRHHR